MFQLTVPGELDQLQAISEQLVRFVDQKGLSEQASYWLNLVIEELFVNVVYHGHGSRTQFTVRIDCSSDELQVTVEDDGPPFNPLNAAAPNLAKSVDQRHVGGLGLHLVRQLSNELTYQRMDDRNVVVATLSLMS